MSSSIVSIAIALAKNQDYLSTMKQANADYVAEFKSMFRVDAKTGHLQSDAASLARIQTWFNDRCTFMSMMTNVRFDPSIQFGTDQAKNNLLLLRVYGEAYTALLCICKCYELPIPEMVCERGGVSRSRCFRTHTRS